MGTPKQGAPNIVGIQQEYKGPGRYLSAMFLGFPVLEAFPVNHFLSHANGGSSQN